MKQCEYERLAKLALDTYGRAPAISPQKAAAVMAGAELPQPGHEKLAAHTQSGDLYVQNHAGEYRVEIYGWSAIGKHWR